MERSRARPAFTLVELLVVVVIVLLVSAATLPSIVTAFSHRQVSEAARIVQAQLVQARDTAIRFNQPRGTRFLPDPTYANSASILAYNRMVPIEPAPEYSNGMVIVWPVSNPSAANTTGVPLPTPAPYPIVTPDIPTPIYPYYPQAFVGAAVNPTANGQVLMIEQAPFVNNDWNLRDPNNIKGGSLDPTSWFWNIRLGDKIQIGNEGQSYTVVGPCTINPLAGGGNPELFVNVGPPGDIKGYITRSYTDSTGARRTALVEFLYLVNGVDDAGLGYTDSGFNGVSDWGLYPAGGPPTTIQGMTPDNLFEWQGETWRGAWAQYAVLDAANGIFTTIVANTVNATAQGLLPPPTPYTISRRPVPSQSARETMLPNNVVVDATTWNSTLERSRLPVDPFSKYIDILVNPSGQVVPTTLYSNPASFGIGASFYQFWLAERGDVHEMTDLWAAAVNPNAPLTFHLPMPQDAYNQYVAGGGAWGTAPTIALTGERMLVTLFSRTGQITTSSVEFFNVKDVNTPFYDSQLGARDGK